MCETEQVVIYYYQLLLQSSLDSSNTEGSFSVLSHCESLPITQENKSLGKFSPLTMNLYVVCIYKKSPNRDDSNAYTQHTIIVQKIEKKKKKS